MIQWVTNYTYIGQKNNPKMVTGLKKKKEKDLFHIVFKVPSGDGPYVRAKHAQLVDKDPEAAMYWFWEAINVGDKVDSALKDMAVVMKQMDQAEEAIEVIKSFRGLCPKNSQESLDNVLIDLYKKCGKVDEQIELLKYKLKLIYLGEIFNGKATKTARSHGKKFQLSVKQETSRILGNLGWAYMQKSNYLGAEMVYQKAQTIDPNANRALNLCYCLLKQRKYNEAESMLQDVVQYRIPGCDDVKTRKRAEELGDELMKNKINISLSINSSSSVCVIFEQEFIEALDRVIKEWAPTRTTRLPIFEHICQYTDF